MIEDKVDVLQTRNSREAPDVTPGSTGNMAPPPPPATPPARPSSLDKSRPPSALPRPSGIPSGRPPLLPGNYK